MNKKKIFYGIKDLCIDAVNLSQYTTEELVIKAAFRGFDAVIKGIEYFAEKKNTERIIRNEANLALSEELAQLKERYAERKYRVEQGSKDYALMRETAIFMLDNLQRMSKMIGTIKSQYDPMAVTEEVAMENQKRILSLEEDYRKLMKQCNKLMNYYEVGRQ